jgi:hypothetical protein
MAEDLAVSVARPLAGFPIQKVGEFDLKGIAHPVTIQAPGTASLAGLPCAGAGTTPTGSCGSRLSARPGSTCAPHGVSADDIADILQRTACEPPLRSAGVRPRHGPHRDGSRHRRRRHSCRLA